jgi:MFS family permease
MSQVNILTTSDSIPVGIKRMTFARGFRWLGWGLCETLIPVLIFSFANSYVEAGIFRSIYDIVYLLALPFIGILADRTPAKYILLFALAIYPLIGISYFLAGALGLAFPIIIARIINGVAWCCDNVGANTYLRRYASRFHLGKSFGYLESLPNLFWMLAALASIPLLKLFPIHYLFLAIVPTSLFASFLLRRLPVDSVRTEKAVTKKYRVSDLLQSLKNARRFPNEVWVLAWLAFFVGCIEVLGTFFLPLFVYNDGGSLSQVVLISVVFAVPSACAFWIGKSIDNFQKKRVIVIALILMAGLLGILSGISNYLFQTIGILILGILLLSVDLSIQSLTTIVAGEGRYGRIGGIMLGANTLGSIFAPIAVGLIADDSGMQTTFIVLGIIAFVTAGGSYLYKFSNMPQQEIIKETI